jgi:hypothetical protein
VNMAAGEPLRNTRRGGAVAKRAAGGQGLWIRHNFVEVFAWE